MKKINEMTDAELKEQLSVLEKFEEAQDLCKSIEEEIAKRKAEAEKAVEEEALKLRAEEKELRRKQHDVLGRYYRIGDACYKVVGVLTDEAFLEYIYQNGYGRFVYKTTLPIDRLLSEGKEITEEEYKSTCSGIYQHVCKREKPIYDDFFDRFCEPLFKNVWF